MKSVHIVGRKNHGKTTLVTALIEELVGRGLQVGAIKHSSHHHELDRPGSDSFQLRRAGASPSTIMAGNLMAVFVPVSDGSDFYRDLEALYAGCDIVLVEGHVDRPALKVEVWRAVIGGPCLAAQRDDIAAVVSDDPAQAPVPVWPRADVARVADGILGLI